MPPTGISKTNLPPAFGACTIWSVPSGICVQAYTVILSFVEQSSVTWIHGSSTVAVQDLPAFLLLPTTTSLLSGQKSTGAVLSVTLIVCTCSPVLPEHMSCSVQVRMIV